MYYSKTQAQAINIPHNYSGSTFRPSEEHFANTSNESSNKESNFETKGDKKDCILEQNCIESKENSSSIPFLSHILSNVSIEDFLLLGIIIVIHQENPNDTTLLLLLILLLAK